MNWRLIQGWTLPLPIYVPSPWARKGSSGQEGETGHCRSLSNHCIRTKRNIAPWCYSFYLWNVINNILNICATGTGIYFTVLQEGMEKALLHLKINIYHIVYVGLMRVFRLYTYCILWPCRVVFMTISQTKAPILLYIFFLSWFHFNLKHFLIFGR